MTCENCGHEMQISDWPFCPHGRGVNKVHQDEIPGGQWFENGFAAPRKFWSHSEHRAALAAEGCEIVAKYAGEHDRHLIDWGAGIDAKTLENAAVLVTRGRISAPETEELGYHISGRGVKGPIPAGFQHG
jgi:hypothetical protein